MVNRVNANPRAPGIGTIDTRTGFETLGAAALDSTVSLAQPFIRQHAERQDKAGATAGTLAIGRDENGHLIPVKLPTGDDVWSQAFRRSYIRGYTRETANDARRVFGQLLDQVKYDSESPLDEFQDKMSVWMETTMANMDLDMEAAMRPMFSEMASQYFTTAQGRKLDFDRQTALTNFQQGWTTNFTDWSIGYSRGMRTASELPELLADYRAELDDHIAIGNLRSQDGQKLMDSAAGLVYGRVAVRAADEAFNAEGFVGAMADAKAFLETDNLGTGLDDIGRKRAYGLMVAQISQRLQLQQYQQAQRKKAQALRRSSYLADLAVRQYQNEPLDEGRILGDIARDPGLVRALSFLEAQRTAAREQERLVNDMKAMTALSTMVGTGGAPAANDITGVMQSVLNGQMSRKTFNAYNNAWRNGLRDAMEAQVEADELAGELRVVDAGGGYRTVKAADFVVTDTRRANPAAFHPHVPEGQAQIIEGLWARGGKPSVATDALKSGLRAQNPQFIRSAANLWALAESRGGVAQQTAHSLVSSSDAQVLSRLAQAHRTGGHSDAELMQLRHSLMTTFGSNSTGSVRPASQQAAFENAATAHIADGNRAMLGQLVREHQNFFGRALANVSRFAADVLPWREDHLMLAKEAFVPPQMLSEFEARVQRLVATSPPGADLDGLRRTAWAQLQEDGWGLTRFGERGGDGEWIRNPFEVIKPGNHGDFDYVDEAMQDRAVALVEADSRYGIDPQEIRAGTARAFLGPIDSRTAHQIGLAPDKVGYELWLRRELDGGGIQYVALSGPKSFIGKTPETLNWQDSAEWRRGRYAAIVTRYNIGDLGRLGNEALSSLYEIGLEFTEGVGDFFEPDPEGPLMPARDLGFVQ